MKLSHTLLICACLVFAGMNFSNAVTPAPAPQQQVQKWEYLEVIWRDRGNDPMPNYVYSDGKVGGYKGTDWLGKVGDEGWELVWYQRLEGPWLTRVWTFKRPKN